MKPEPESLYERPLTSQSIEVFNLNWKAKTQKSPKVLSTSHIPLIQAYMSYFTSCSVILIWFIVWQFFSFFSLFIFILLEYKKKLLSALIQKNKLQNLKKREKISFCYYFWFIWKVHMSTINLIQKF